MTADEMFVEIAGLRAEAAQVCRCDGGCAPCSSCVAARLLSKYGTQTSRFDSSKPNLANTPKEAATHSTVTRFYIDEEPNGTRYFIDGVLVSAVVFARRRLGECIHRLFRGRCRDCAYVPKPVKWIMHGDYAHVAGQPCAVCNPPSDLAQYRRLLANCYCPPATSSGYKSWCMNCVSAHELAPKIVNAMLEGK